MGEPVRHLVLDNEAVSALLVRAPMAAERAGVLEAIVARTAGRSCRPPCAAKRRGAARISHLRQPTCTSRTITHLTLPATTAACSCVRLFRPDPSFDARVVVGAERLQGGDIVAILTSDPGDVAALAGNADPTVDVYAL